MRFIQLTLACFIFFANSTAQPGYSSLDKAKIINASDLDKLNYYIINQNVFEDLTKKKGLSAITALDYFRHINHAKNVKTETNLVKVFNYLINNDIDVTPLIKIIDINPNIDIGIKDLTDEEIDKFIVNYFQPLTIDEGYKVAGAPVSASGVNFSTNMLQATAELLIDRGEKELANSFFQEISYKLENDLELNMLFPNTSQIFKERYQYTIPSLGPAWRGAFELDLDELPNNLIKYVEFKTPIEKHRMQMLNIMVNGIRELERGQHPYEIINNLYLKLPNENPYRNPLHLISIISQEMSVRRKLSEYGANQTWANLSDFRELDLKGKIILSGLLFKKLKDNNFVLLNVNEEKLMSMVSEITSFLSLVDNTQKYFTNQPADNQKKIEIFARVTTNTMETILSVNSIISNLDINMQNPDQDLDVINRQLKNTKEIVITFTKMKQAIQTDNYGKLLAYSLDIFKNLNFKTTNQIQDFLKTARNNAVQKLENTNKTEFKKLIDHLNNNNNFTCEQSEFLDKYLIEKKIEIEELLMDLKKIKVRSEARKIIFTEFDKIILKVPEEFVRILTFTSEISQAKEAEEIKAILDANILPVGSYRMKRQPGYKNFFLQGFAGGNLGYEFLNRSGVNGEFDGIFFGLFLPIGIEITRSKLNTINNYNGIFISFIDLAAVGSFNLMNENELDIPSIGFENVFAVGLYYTHGLKDAPITWGLGVRHAPQLRKIDVLDDESLANLNGKILDALQVHGFIAVDIPLLRISRVRR